MNESNEALGFICIHIFTELLLHLDGLKNPSEVWHKLKSLFFEDEFRVHILENELISLQPNNFETIEKFFSKIKYLVMQWKKCGIKKKNYNWFSSFWAKLAHNSYCSFPLFIPGYSQLQTGEFPLLMHSHNVQSKGKKKETNKNKSHIRPKQRQNPSNGASSFKKDKHKRFENTKCSYCKTGNHP